ncbi:hypothetical protein [Tenacibaculum aestuariivivum]|uniref:hypothetical protein n=1 Tax=Tenacibaculum aestuariivivum TaxID=2006131 RepID=UPI003AB23550
MQFDEPFLTLYINEKAREAYKFVYITLKKEFPYLKILVATYFNGLKDNIFLATTLPVYALHIDFGTLS